MGPLSGLTVIEIKGIGPGPYAGMLLADLGASVIVVDRVGATGGIGLPAVNDVHSRGKQSIALDLKNPHARAALLRLVDGADALLEGFRPGVAERLGFGPDDCLKRNPKLVYGRLTGWGQSGPLAGAAGHDINYISLSGVLAAIGENAKPTPPLNLVGDYSGGSLFLVIGMLAALLKVKESGEGQVIDAAITDGTASLMSMFYGFDAKGLWSPQRQSNLLDGAAHHYAVYETADGLFVSIGSLEPQFYQLLIEKLGLDPDLYAQSHDAARWPERKNQLASVFKEHTQQYWCGLLEGTDVCFAPVLDYRAAPSHRHNQARQTYIEIDGLTQPAPAPRFSHTPCATPAAPHIEGADTDALLQKAGYSAAEIAALKASGAVA